MGSLRAIRKPPCSRVCGRVKQVACRHAAQTPMPSTRLRWLKYSISAIESQPATDRIA